MKSKIAITIDSKLLKRIDEINKNKNRSAFIEEIVKNSMESKTLTTAVLLSGGLGSRLRPLTYEMAKPLIPVKGKPVLRWQIEMLKNNGINNIIVSIGKQSHPNQIINAFGNEVTYVFEDKPLGTGGALTKMKDMVDDNFLVMNADTLHSPSPNINGMFDFHLEKGKTATLLVTLKKDVSSFGMVLMKDDGKIVDFVEKPKGFGAGLISSGIYILNKEIFKYIKTSCSIENYIFPKLKDKGLLYGYLFNGKTYDVGTLKGYETAIKEWRPDI